MPDRPTTRSSRHPKNSVPGQCQRGLGVRSPHDPVRTTVPSSCFPAKDLPRQPNRGGEVTWDPSLPVSVSQRHFLTECEPPTPSVTPPDGPTHGIQTPRVDSYPTTPDPRRLPSRDPSHPSMKGLGAWTCPPSEGTWREKVVSHTVGLNPGDARPVRVPQGVGRRRLYEPVGGTLLCLGTRSGGGGGGEGRRQACALLLG